MTQQIQELYEPALDAGISPETFWHSSLAQIWDLMQSARRVRETELKERLSMFYLLGANIRERFSDGKVTPLWELFPDLFAEEKEAYERSQTVPVEEMVERRKRYAEIWNKRRRGEL